MADPGTIDQTLNRACYHAPILTGWQLHDIEFPPIRWAIPNLLPEGLTILAGKPKTGKSWLALNLAAAISVGARVLGQIEVERGNVLYLALEDTPRRLQGRLEEIRALPSRDLFLATQWRRGEEGREDLDRWLTDYPDTRLVIIDTLARIRSARPENGAAYDIDYGEIAAIKTLADRHGTAILLLHHTRKREATDYLDEVSGTLGLSGAADTVAVLKRIRGKTGAELLITGRDLEKDTELALEFQERIGWTLLGDAEEYRQTEARRQILGAFTNGQALTARAIADLLDKNYNTTRSLIAKLVNDGHLVKRGGGYGKA